MADPARRDDNAFGPQYGDSFDFTIRFENTILTIVPTSLLIVLFPYLLYKYTQQPIVVGRSWFSWAKTLIATGAAGLELANLIVWTQQSAHNSVYSIAASGLAFVAAICVIGILDFEHRHALRSSSILGFYLILSLLFDATRARTYSARGNLSIHASLAAATAALKGVLLLLGESSKRGQIQDLKLQQTAGPENTSGFLNRSLFLWVNRTLVIGFRKVLDLEDLQHLGPEFSSAHLSDAFTTVWDKTDKSSSQCLLKALLTVLAKPLFASVIPRLCHVALEFVAPFYLKRIVEYVAESDRSLDVGRGLIGATVLIFAGRAISITVSRHLAYRLVTLSRGVLVAQIFRKSLAMDYLEASKNSAMTLMSTDIEGLVEGLADIHDIWLSFVQVGLGTYLLSTVVGRATFVVVIPITISAVFAVALAKRIGPSQGRWNEKVQQRVSMTVQVFKNLKGIKMLGLESAITDFLQTIRVSEINTSKPYRFWTATNLFMTLLAILITPVLVIAVAIFWAAPSGRLSAAEAYATLAIVFLIAVPLMDMLRSYSTFGSTVACVSRIQEFLLLDEVKDQRVRGNNVQATDPRRFNEKPGDSESTHSRRSNVATTPFAIQLDQVSIKSRLDDRLLLEDATFSVKRSSVSLIFGPVGSGKSVLLKALLGEVQFVGSLYVDAGAIAYCDQIPWVQNCSIRQNITGEQDFDEHWYNSILDACLLKEDLATITNGDEGFAGSDGVSLSGGQKQRVALARALYSRAAIFILDDILSGLDASSARTIAYRLFGNGGLFQALQATVIMATHTDYCLEFAHQLLILDGAGRIQSQPNESQGRSNIVLAPFLTLEVAQSKTELISGHKASTKERADELAVAQEDTLRQKGNFELYALYFNSARRWKVLTFLAGCILSGATEVFPSIYYRIWLSAGPDNNLYFIGYAGVSILACVVGASMNFFFYVVVVPDSSNSLHKKLLDSMMGATLSFLTSTDAGSVLNRFSQDMTLLSQTLPRAALQVFYSAAIAVVEIAVVFAGASYAGAMLPLVFVAVYAIQHFYLRTSRQMRFLDLEAKTPLYTHVAETASGLYHIRSFGRAANVYEDGLKLLDTSQRPFYYMFCIQRWLQLTVELVGTATAVFVVCLAVLLPQTATPPGFGLAMLSLFLLGQDITTLIEKWTAIETSLGAIARLRSFTRDTPAESDNTVATTAPPQYWPQTGRITMSNMSATYSSKDVQNLVLRNVSLDIPAGHKVGVVGRTGSGKSSLIVALLNFLEFTGSITIDGVDIRTLQRDDLRSRITSIPQTPVELAGSVRQNILPFRQHTEAAGGVAATASTESSDDLTAIDVLSEIRLWDYIKEHGGLDATMEEMAFSSGQKQLLSIARAILHSRNTGSRVVLMDEPTSDLDMDADRHVQRVMAKAFSHCTVLCVAHRLETVQDADIIIEIVDGRIDKMYTPNRD